MDASAAEKIAATRMQLMLTKRISELEEQPLVGTESRALKYTIQVVRHLLLLYVFFPSVLFRVTARGTLFFFVWLNVC